MSEMTRAEAIEEIIAAWRARDSEFCCSSAERVSSSSDLLAALRALGVTQEEIRSYFYKGNVNRTKTRYS